MTIGGNELFLLDGVLIGILFAVLLYVWIIRPFQRRHDQKVLRQRKDQFIAISSHYLLSPISIIQSALSALEVDDTSLTLAKRQRLYNAIAQGNQRLLILAEQLFVVGEFDQNDLKLNMAVGDLVDTVSGAIAAVDAFSREKKIKMSFTNQLQDLIQAKFDARRLKQAIIAVLDNAIKFSPEGRVVQVVLSQNADIFSIAITDEGIGMSEEILAHLSDPFYRGNSLYNYDYEGMGLGLHIAQAILKLHEGIITFDSHPSRGTTATLQLPNL